MQVVNMQAVKGCHVSRKDVKRRLEKINTITAFVLYADTLKIQREGTKL